MKTISQLISIKEFGLSVMASWFAPALFIKVLVFSVFISQIIQCEGNSSQTPDSPEITSFTADADELLSNQITILTVVADDPNGSSLAYHYSIKEGTGTLAQSESDSVEFTSGTTEETVEITVTVTNDNGKTARASLSISVTVLAPVIKGFVSDKMILAENSVANFTVTASDPDDLPISYSYEITAGTGNLGGSSTNTEIFTSNNNEENVTIQVTVINSASKSATASLTIAVDSQGSTPGGSGVISEGTITSDSVEISWQEASDSTSSSDTLLYLVYTSNSANIGNVEMMELNGTAIGDYSLFADVQKVFSSLSPSTTYYYNVIVKDEAGHKTGYSTITVSTSCLSINGYCFYLAAANQNCASVCASHGGYNLAGTNWTVVFPGTNCTQVLNALGKPGAAASTGGAQGYCCRYSIDNIRNEYYNGDPSCASDLTNSVVQRACSCVE